MYQTHKSVNKTFQRESDTISTNFWPTKPRVVPPSRQSTSEKRNQDLSISRPKSVSYSRKFRIIKGITSKIKTTSDALVYKKQLQYFSELYEQLGNVLSSVRTGLEDFQKAVTQYGRYLQKPHMSFIDDFIQSRDSKIKKSIRTSRIHECLSVAYLFLQIAQQRMYNNQSYLVNFIGHSLSNLLFAARIYILLENRPEFEKNQFHQRVEQSEIASYGKILTNLEDVLLRVQHNNEIITLIHKKLGRENQKFQLCIKAFLKNAQRKKYSSCLCSHYIFEYLAMHIYESQLQGISQFLQVAPTPYLAPATKKYTIVIQPLGVLKHGNTIRPYVIQFMRWLQKHFDVILWTWQMPYQVESLVEMIDPFLTAKLYRYHCIYKDQVFVKDLNRLGRNVSETLIIDYDPRIFPNHLKNGFVCRWKGAKKDKSLLVICQILQQMLTSQSSVQEMLIFYAEQLHSIRGF